jgi:hypothetical protein
MIVWKLDLQLPVHQYLSWWGVRDTTLWDKYVRWRRLCTIKKHLFLYFDNFDLFLTAKSYVFSFHFCFHEFGWSKNPLITFWDNCLYSVSTNINSDIYDGLKSAFTDVIISNTSNPQIHVLFLHQTFIQCTSDQCSFFKSSNRRPIFKSMAVSHFLKSRSNNVTDGILNFFLFKWDFEKTNFAMTFT